MPYTQPGKVQDVRATKAHVHGAPACEDGLSGIAEKSEQALPAYPTPENALAATRIASGEFFVLNTEGLVEVSTDLLPGGAAKGTRLYITEADDRLVDRSTALTSGLIRDGFLKFGLIAWIETEQERAYVNLNRRDMF